MEYSLVAPSLQAEILAAGERIKQLEAALEVVLSVRMLDNLTLEQWAQINAVRRRTQ